MDLARLDQHPLGFTVFFIQKIERGDCVNDIRVCAIAGFTRTLLALYVPRHPSFILRQYLAFGCQISTEVEL